MPSILIIDKDNNSYARMSALLQGIGFDTLQNTGFDEAKITIYAKVLYAIFIDLSTISSIDEIAYILKATKPRSIVTIMGSEDYADTICQAIELGVDDFFRTPFSDKIFMARSRNMMARINEIRDSHIRKLNSLIDFLPVMMMVSDGNGTIISANQPILNKFGKNIDDIKGAMIGDLLSCSSSSGARCHLSCGFCKIADLEREVARTGKRIIRKEVSYIQHKDGKPHKRSLKLSMAPIEYDNRNLVIINLEDVTFERNAFDVMSSTIDDLRKSYDDSQDQVKVSSELADYLQEINNSLEAEKTKLRKLFDNMSSGFFRFSRKDGKMYFEEANTKACEMFNQNLSQYRGCEVTGGKFCEQELFDAMVKVLDTGESINMTLKSELFAGHFDLSIYKPEDENVGVIIRNTSNEVRNLNENKMLTRMLKRQNIELDDKNVELKKAVETKNKFISIIAHDLKNPFNAINGLSELLMKRLNQEIDSRAHEMAKIIHDSAKGAYELLENLLVWARTQQNTIQFSPATLNLHTVTAETINEIKVQAEKKNIMLFNQTEPGDNIWADKQMLQTIIRNITSNAIKFTNEGGIIVIGSQKTENETIITIEDNGVGMTEETRQKLMTVGKNKSTKGTAGETGSGMGLLISKEFIEKHHGKVEVASELGMGTTFTISFPNHEDVD
ncbi:MAG: ATP-binding protein [Bacteroidales bacterium]|nr:ATP-binding protein [Bacteroidales bacterium]